MAKIKGDKKLYQRMRISGVRKKVARELAELPGMNSNGKQAPKAMRDAVERLERIVSELRGHAVRSERRATARRATARKAARTRRTTAQRSRSSTRSSGSTRRSSSTRKPATKRARA